MPQHLASNFKIDEEQMSLLRLVLVRISVQLYKWILRDGQCADKAAIRGVVHSQMHLRHLRSVSMKQRRIAEFFNSK